MVLHKELAFWFAHKIEGVADDAHLYYKQEFCREWHSILGAPPEDYEEHVAWMKEIADAPETLQDAEALAPGGIVIYETFAKGNERFGKPSNPDFLLNENELLSAFLGRLKIIAYEDVVVEHPRPAAVQRLCGQAPPSGGLCQAEGCSISSSL